MRSLLLLIFCLSGYLSAQVSGIFPIRSPYSYKYKLSTSQAEQFLRYQEPVRLADLDAPLDSTQTRFDTEKWEPGYYFIVHSRQNQEQYELVSLYRWQAWIVNNERDLMVTILDSLGLPIVDAEVEIAKKHIPFDTLTQTYRLPKTVKEGLLKITYLGHTDFYQVEGQNTTPKILQLGKRIAYIPPIRWVWRIPYRFVRDNIKAIKYRIWPDYIFTLGYPVRRIFNPKGYGKHRNETNSYLAMDKPRYRPGDSVRIKAIVLGYKQKILNKQLELWIVPINRYTTDEKSFKVHTLTPYRSSTYAYSFALHDSMNLILGKTYRFELREIGGAVKIGANFWYEDYELNGIEASLHLSKDRQYKGKKFEVKARLFDSNNLEVPGASVTLELLSDYMNQLYTPSIFIPNKLWEHKQILDPLGPTHIVIPDSIFPLVDLGYRIQATFETVDGKSFTQKASAFYYHDPCQIIFQEKRDQITIEAADLDACPLEDSLAQVLMRNDQQILFDQSLSLPTALPLNPMAAKYEMRWGEYTETYEPQVDLLEVGGERTKDSLFIQISNPQELSVWYQLWEGKKKAILRGSERTLFLRIKARKDRPYFLTVSHMWKGELKTQNYLFHLTPHKLQVELEAPEKVYPGQNIPLTISVKDYQGVPVQGADVLAYAFTSKFYRYPSLEIPHAADPIPTKSPYNSFEKTQLRKTQTYALDFPFWQQAFTLDKDTAYQLLYPGKEPCHVYFPSIHEKTQFTPVVVEQGKPVPIMVAYLDRNPTHVAGVIQPYPYTIFADSGWHDLMIKTHDRILQIDSVYFASGKQTVISIDQAQCNCSQNVEKDVLGDQELRRLSQSLIKIEHGYPQTSPAYIQQGDRVHLLGYLTRRDYSSYKPNMYIGPLTSDSVHFEALGKFKLSFSYQYGYTHTFFPQMLMVKADPWDLDELRMQILQTRFTSSELTTLVQPAISPYDLKKNYAEAIQTSVDQVTKYKHPQATRSGYGMMLISPLYPKPDILLLFRHSDTSFLRVYPGRTQVFHQLPPDNYYLQAWYSDSQYVLIDSLDIPPNGRTYFQWDSLPIQQADSLMKQLYQLATAKWEDELAADSQKRKIKQIEQVKRPVLDGPLIQITGQVVDLETGEPIEGVAVVIKGSNVGMFTDAKGYFNLEAPHNALLYFGFIGKIADEQPAYKFSGFNTQPQIVYMEEASMLLSEGVEVIGDRLNRVYSGIDITHAPNPLFEFDIITVDEWARQLTASMNIHGVKESAVKYYIDGIKVRGNQALPVQSIVNSQLISDEIDPNLTVWITTDGSVELPDGPRFKAKGDQEIPRQDLLDEPAALRTHFDDVAYWRPSLMTDQNGEATFFATLPDDITQWRHRALVYDFAGKSGGQATAFSRSYKSLMAQLSLPRFLVEGDQTTAFGRAENLLGDSLNVRLSFASKSQNYSSQDVLLSRYQIDTLQFQAPATQDSLALTFRLDVAENEYYDGETRRIPLFQKGDKQVEGQYKMLNRGESMELHASDQYPVQVVAHANKLEICLKEIDRVQAYRYDCNEQLASKLKTLLMAQRIHQQLQRPFRQKKRVRELIKKLEKSHNESFLWGWWAGNTTTPWINQHVIEALLQAEEMGYSILLSKNLIQREIIFQLSHRTLPARVQVPFLETLENMGADFPFEDFIPKVEADTLLNPVDKLRLIRLRQKLDMDPPLDTLWKYQEETSLDGIYWKGSGRKLRYQTIPATLAAYQILADMEGQEAKLDKMEAWLLKQRKPTGWNNTYYTSQILETILGRLLDGGSELEAPQLLAYTSTGVDTIHVFPYESTFPPGQLQQLVHQGQTPIYTTAFQTRWDTLPQVADSLFVLQSYWIHEKDTLTKLEAGQKIKLSVQVEVKKDAEYVLLEIPIPAGCSYSEHGLGRGSHEAYREQKRDRVGICFKRLPQGTYTYDVFLQARFPGTYTLNPPKMELMYFPTKNGRGEMERLDIK